MELGTGCLLRGVGAGVGGGTALSTCTCSVRELVRGPWWASDEQIAAVDRRGAELDDDLARAGDRVATCSKLRAPPLRTTTAFTGAIVWH